MSDNTNDSIVARISEELIHRLNMISTRAGYDFTPSAVDRVRVTPIVGPWPFVVLHDPVEEIVDGANDTDVSTLTYCVSFLNICADGAQNDESASYQHRNVTSDITRAIVGTDRQFNGLIESIKTTMRGSGIAEDVAGNRFYQAYVIFKIMARIDSNDPRLLG